MIIVATRWSICPVLIRQEKIPNFAFPLSWFHAPLGLRTADCELVRDFSVLVMEGLDGTGAWIPVLDNDFFGLFVLSMRQLVFQVSKEDFLDLIKYIIWYN